MGTFDCAYAIEAICHSPDPELTYGNIYNMLKPGGVFGTFEWVMTKNYDPSSSYHNKIKHGVEEGDALPSIRTAAQYITCLEKAGFEIIEHYDLNDNNKSS